MTEQKYDLRAMLKAIHDGDPEEIFDAPTSFTVTFKGSKTVIPK
jgi:hypothetical protein